MNKLSGFTLVELLIVIIIIAVLAAIAIPSYQNYVTKSKIKEAQSNLIALSLSAENFYQRSLNFPTASLANTPAIKGSDAFKTWNNSSDAFSYAYVSADGSDYTFTATGLDPRVTNCTISLTNTGAKTVSGCGSVSSWVN
jgi:type IV pilus assembly protein PilE